MICVMLARYESADNYRCTNDIRVDMYKIRRRCLNSWVTRPILGVFLLWAGMFVCLLPGEAYATLSPTDPSMTTAQELQAPVSDHTSSDCVETDSESMPTYCESDGKTVVLSDFVKIIGISNDAIDRFSEYVPFLTGVRVIPESPVIRHVSIFLLTCSFLK